MVAMKLEETVIQPLSGTELTKRCREMVDQWCCGWGSVILEREQTGDSVAIPRNDWFDSSGQRCSPSNLPAVVDAYLDIERFLSTKQPGVRRMLDWRFVRCWHDRIAWRKWVFEDGGEIVLLDTDPDPIVPAVVQHVEAIRYIQADWREFVKAEVEAKHLDPKACKIEQYGSSGWAEHFEFIFKRLVLAISDELDIDKRVQEIHQRQESRRLTRHRPDAPAAPKKGTPENL